MGLLSSLFGGRPTIEPTAVRTVDEFREVVIESELPVVVDVWSPTCAPCRKLWHELVVFASRNPERVKVVEINTQAEPKLLGGLGVQATPTLIVFDQGEEFARFVGYKPRSWLQEMLDHEFPAA